MLLQSTLSDRVNPNTACFELAYTGAINCAPNAKIEAMFIITPPRFRLSFRIRSIPTSVEFATPP